jgi:DNA-binding transcriptional ArsR family regulator
MIISKFLELRLTPSNFQLSFTNMRIDYDTAATLLNRLGNPTRLKIVRELVRAGRSGLSVGEVQSRLGIPNSTLSHHINLLRSVDLIRQQRESTILRCFVNYDKIEQIVRFLTEECCAAEVKILS